MIQKPPMVTPEEPSRGVRLWRDLQGDAQAPEVKVLLEEACRIADRLDRLDALLDGTAEDWIELIETRGDENVLTVIIDKPLAEARQQALALKAILTELRTVGLVGKTGKGVPARDADNVSWLPARSAKSQG